MNAPAKIDALDMLAADLARFYDDPLGYVLWSFPWGQGVLEGERGPRGWQREFLQEVGQQVRDRAFDGVNPVQPLRFSTASGHGIGKSALTAWLIKWIMDTRPGAKGTVTANTGDQLRTKTWAELAKWHKLSITRDLFDYYNSRGNMSLQAREDPENWRCDALTCREENSEGFAGQHAAGSTPFYIFDEASAVPDAIHEVAEGGMTDGEPMMFLFGNPTRNTGRFRQTHGRLRHRWTTRKIDSRTVEGTNKALFEEWVRDFGEDSDFVKVRVRGEFPSASSLQFIASDLVEAARRTEPHAVLTDPVVIGVDVARFGDDATVIHPRRGKDARSLPRGVYRGLDTMQVAARVAEMAREHHASAVFVDAGGVGGGVVDRLRQLNVRGVIGVQFGGKPDNAAITKSGARGEKYANKRAEIWGALRSALVEGLAIPDDADLQEELVGVEYAYNQRDEILLESKESMKKRGLASPDGGDALALTFAYPIGALRDHQRPGGAPERLPGHDYDPYEDM